MTWHCQRKDDAAPCEGRKCTYVMLAQDLETGRDREIFPINATSLENASISPDGRHLAFAARDEGLPSIVVVPVAGGAPR